MLKDVCMCLQPFKKKEQTQNCINVKQNFFIYLHAEGRWKQFSHLSKVNNNSDTRICLCNKIYRPLVWINFQLNGRSGNEYHWSRQYSYRKKNTAITNQPLYLSNNWSTTVLKQ